jgi:beta-carotene hydroxylase
MGQNYHLVHHLWPSIPWFEYKPAYEATKSLLDSKGSPQRLGIFETRRDGYNFLYTTSWWVSEVTNVVEER